MAEYKVVHIVDGDTFDVSPNWEWGEESGSRVRPAGYDAAELGTHSGLEHKAILEYLILNENVELGEKYRIDRGRLVCKVFFQGHDLASFFHS